MGRASVIIVDDSMTIVKALSFTLQGMSLDVDSYTSPKEGIIKISEKKYDLLILDLEMPEINGIQFLTELKNRGIKIPIIVLTGKKDDRLIVGIMSSFPDVKNYLIKPHNKEELERSVKTILKI